MERRHHLRVETPILLEFPNPSTKTMERSFTQDVSEAGLRFPTPVRFQVGQDVPPALQVPSQSTIRITGTVVWVREVSRLGPTQYDVGIRFQWIEDPDRQRLTRHLREFVRR